MDRLSANTVFDFQTLKSAVSEIDTAQMTGRSVTITADQERLLVQNFEGATASGCLTKKTSTPLEGVVENRVLLKPWSETPSCTTQAMHDEPEDPIEGLFHKPIPGYPWPRSRTIVVFFTKPTAF